jgi:hypothetical protein
MAYDYNVYSDNGDLDYWSEEPSEAFFAFFQYCTTAVVPPRISRYPVGLNAAGERTTFTDRWDTLTWRQLAYEAFPWLTDPHACEVCGGRGHHPESVGMSGTCPECEGTGFPQS